MLAWEWVAIASGRVVESRFFDTAVVGLVTLLVILAFRRVSKFALRLTTFIVKWALAFLVVHMASTALEQSIHYRLLKQEVVDIGRRFAFERWTNEL